MVSSQSFCVGRDDHLCPSIHDVTVTGVRYEVCDDDLSKDFKQVFDALAPCRGCSEPDSCRHEVMCCVVIKIQGNLFRKETPVYPKQVCFIGDVKV